MMIVREASDQDIGYVLGNLRAHCRRELFATRPGDDMHAMTELAYEIDRMRPWALLRAALVPAGADAPAAIFAAYLTSASVAAFQTFSTDAWPLVARDFVRWFVKVVEPRLAIMGVRMAEFNVLATPDFDVRWFALMHCWPWGDPLPRGRNGEAYWPMVWLNPTVDAARARAGSAPIGASRSCVISTSSSRAS